MKNAFLGDAPSWIQNEVPMIEGKGTPTQTYMTLRIMKILGVGFGEPVTARMSTIQNIEAIMQLEQQVRAGIARNEQVGPIVVVDIDRHHTESASDMLPDAGSFAHIGKGTIPVVVKKPRTAAGVRLLVAVDGLSAVLAGLRLGEREPGVIADE